MDVKSTFGLTAERPALRSARRRVEPQYLPGEPETDTDTVKGEEDDG